MDIFRFGEFDLDMDRYELRRGGHGIRTEPRVLELLHYLIQQRERVVPKEELLDNLWAGTHVSDSALTSTIRDARKALSDSPASPRWIKTVYGRGVRFVGSATTATGAEAPIAPAPKPATPPRKSIAVLPFTDLSSARDQAYFCDGMAEELINSLTRIDELRVVSRAVAFDFRNDDDFRELGEKLGVNHVLRGSVRKAGDLLRITVHLVDVRSRHHVWSEKYDRTTTDIFALQEEIAEHTVRALLGVMTDRNRQAIKSTPVRLDVYEFYLKGRTYLSQSALEHAVEMFEIAIEFDPDYAPAYAGLADALAELYAANGQEALRERAEAASVRAVELAPDLAEAHVCRGQMLALAGLHREASAEFELAMSINPRSFDAHYHYGRLRQVEGKLVDAARLLELAWEIEPSDYQAPAALVDLYRAAGREQASRGAAARARELAEHHLERRPNDARARRWLGAPPSS